MNYIADSFDDMKFLMCNYGETYYGECAVGEIFLEGSIPPCKKVESTDNQCSKSGEIFPVLPKCNSYTSCILTSDGIQAKTSDCPTDTPYFYINEENVAACVAEIAKPEFKCTEDGAVQDNLECNAYRFCSGSTETNDNGKPFCCPQNTIFDPKKKTCVDDDGSVQCSIKVNPCMLAANEDIEFHC